MPISEGDFKEKNTIMQAKYVKRCYHLEKPQKLASIDVLNIKILQLYIWHLHFLPYSHFEKKINKTIFILIFPLTF